ncbi:hypothetical protein UFOVP257_388 [uncultured Caudovirales phage]|uniref:Uncharacterized protein n=1 Tax=uncultured Caudovirales phage TaxID=2100421 RepID=A0A6J5LKM6_9CAUD|nr:hypothetical protein UFOVP257_388 [uncultured Caudovirales phage]
MKRILRFIKWFINKSTWYDFVLFITCFTVAFGFGAGESTARNISWGIAVAVNIIFMIGFMIKGLIHMWRDFKKYDEKVFDILKQEKIK